MVMLFLTVVSSVAIILGFWYIHARERMRHELVLKLLESGQALDAATVDRLLAPTPPAALAPAKPGDPRDPYRNGGFVYFVIGFGTLLFAFTRAGGVSYPVLALGLVPFAVAFRVWAATEREFRAGTLPTLTGEADPRNAHFSGGFVFFLIGYATIFIGLVRAAGSSFPLIGLGLLTIGLAFSVWRAGEREYRAGVLTGSVPPASRQ